MSINTIDYDTAVAIVKQLFGTAKEPLLTVELEATKSNYTYRPYIVYAKLVLTEYRHLTRADEVSFAQNSKAVKGALAMQKALDDGDNTIPPSQTVDHIEELLDRLTATNQIGVMIV